MAVNAYMRLGTGIQEATFYVTTDGTGRQITLYGSSTTNVIPVDFGSQIRAVDINPSPSRVDGYRLEFYATSDYSGTPIYSEEFSEYPYYNATSARLYAKLVLRNSLVRIGYNISALTSCDIYDNYNYSGTLFSGSGSFATYPGHVITITNIQVASGYNPDSFTISFFRENESRPWRTVNLGDGTSFTVDNNYAQFTIVGERRSTSICIALDSSVNSATVSLTTDGVQRSVALYSGVNYLYADIGSVIGVSAIDPDTDEVSGYYVNFYSDDFFSDYDVIEVQSYTGYPFYYVLNNNRSYAKLFSRSNRPNAYVELGDGVNSLTISFASSSDTYVLSRSEGIKNFYVPDYDVIYLTDISVGNDYGHPYTLDFFDPGSLLPFDTFTVQSGNIASYTVEGRRFRCVISAKRTGVTYPVVFQADYPCSVYINGNLMAKLRDSSVTLSIRQGDLIEIGDVVPDHFQKETLEILVYANYSVAPIDSFVLDPEHGSSFSVSSVNITQVLITGMRYQTRTVYLRRDPSIQTARIIVDGNIDSPITLYSTTSNSFQAYPDSMIEFIYLDPSPTEVHWYELNFFSGGYTSTPSKQYLFASYPSYSPESDDFLYGEIKAVVNEDVTITYETIGVSSFKIYVDGNLYATVTPSVSYHYGTITAVKDALIEIMDISLMAHYDRESYEVTFYKTGEGSPWSREPLDVLTGVAFYVDDNHARFGIKGEAYQTRTVYLRRDPSIQTARIIVDGNIDSPITLYSTTSNSFQAYPDSMIEFIQADIDENFTWPIVLNFYDSSYSEILARAAFPYQLGLPFYKAVDSHIYAEVTASVAKFLWYTTETEDALYIQRGNLFTQNFSAEMWNRFRATLKRVAALYNLEYNYTDVEEGNIFYGSDFSDALDILQLLPGTTMTIGRKGTGATVYASYFQNSGDPAIDFHGNSIKKALNEAIEYYNTHEEDE